jgi:diguanylate cyclase (GGDEF)-like protein
MLLLAGVLSACWWVQRSQQTSRFLLWIAAGSAMSAFALALQSMMNNIQWGEWTLLIGALYLVGSWCMAEGMAQRQGGQTSLGYGVLVVGVTLGGVYFFSYLQNDLWIRVQWLNAGVGALLFLALPSLMRASPARDGLEKVARWTFIVFSAYSLLRPFVAWWLLPAPDVVQLSRSSYWLVTLAAALLFSLWFSLVLIACSVRDVFTTLREERNRDPLTLLLNRRAFMEAAENILNDRRSGPWAVVVVDIDHFKHVNDSWGHAFGDRVLQLVSHVQQQQLRSGDLVARFGGEEFVLLLQRTSLADAQGVVERIRQQLAVAEEQLLPNGEHVTLSCGIAPVQGLLHLTKALSRADGLMYEAKQSGRNRVHVDMPLPTVDSHSEHGSMKLAD